MSTYRNVVYEINICFNKFQVVILIKLIYVWYNHYIIAAKTTHDDLQCCNFSAKVCAMAWVLRLFLQLILRQRQLIIVNYKTMHLSASVLELSDLIKFGVYHYQKIILFDILLSWGYCYPVPVGETRDRWWWCKRWICRKCGLS